LAVDTAEDPFCSSTCAPGKTAAVESLIVPATPPTCAAAGVEAEGA
jgi:hypothetical protein